LAVNDIFYVTLPEKLILLRSSLSAFRISLSSWRNLLLWIAIFVEVFSVCALGQAAVQICGKGTQVIIYFWFLKMKKVKVSYVVWLFKHKLQHFSIIICSSNHTISKRI